MEEGMERLRIVFIGDACCQKKKLICAYSSGQFSDSDLLQNIIRVTKAIGHKTPNTGGGMNVGIGSGLQNNGGLNNSSNLGRKKKKTNKFSVIINAISDDKESQIDYVDKNVYVFLFSFKDLRSLENLILRYASLAYEYSENTYEDRDKIRILLGVDAEEKDKKTDINPMLIRNIATALNVNGYFEINSKDIDSVKKSIDNIIKVALVKKGWYPQERIEGYIPLEDSPIPYVWGRMIVSVLRAENLIPKDGNGKSDPFCKIGWCNSIKDISMKFIHQTKRKNETINPTWTEYDNNTKTYNLDDNVSKFMYLKIQVFDHDITSSDDFEGEIRIPITQLFQESPGEMSLPLSDRPDSNSNQPVTGRLFFRWRFKPRKRKLPNTIPKKIIVTEKSTTRIMRKSKSKQDGAGLTRAATSLKIIANSSNINGSNYNITGSKDKNTSSDDTKEGNSKK